MIMKMYLLSFLVTTWAWTKPVIFYHIPKTAGSTTRYLLESQFDCHEVCPGIFYFEIESKRPSDLSRFNLFAGHFFYNSNLKYINGTRITFMRDPVERIISEQRFYKKFYEDTDRRAVLAMQHYNPEGEPIDVVSNLQVLYLSSLDRNDLSISWEKHYESALKNLRENFDFVGIVEDYERSIRSLFEKMGWEQKEIIPILQSADLDYQISDEKIHEIKERNKFDILLYEEAKKLFYSKYHVTKYAAPKPLEYVDEISLDFKNKIPAEGFGPKINICDQIFRPITSSGYAFIKVPLKNTENYQLLIHANQSINDPHFKIICNGFDLEYRSSKGKVFTGIPKEFINPSGYTKIEFIIDNLDSKNLKWDRGNNTNRYSFRKIDITVLD